jgi:adenosylhomocysteine nucleosidase
VTTVGFLAPMRSELRPLVRRLGMRRVTRGAHDVYEGVYLGQRVVATTTGMGTERAARRAAELIDGWGVDELVVVGVAGAVAGARVGEVVVPEVVEDHASGDDFRHSPRAPTAVRGRLLTTDELIKDPDQLRRLAARGVVALDMETAAVAGVCEARGCRWSVFRAISDDAFDPSIDESILGLSRADGTADLAAVARYVVADPRRIRLLSRLGRDLGRATNAAVGAALASLSSPDGEGPPDRDGHPR